MKSFGFVDSFAIPSSPAKSPTADKELLIVPGATHIRTYFVKEYVDLITAKIRQFFII